MTDTTELLKYAEELNLRNGETSATIFFHSDHLTRVVAYDGQAGEVIKELLHTILSATQHQENCVKTNNDALRGTTWHILNNGVTRATAILGGNLQDKTDEAHNG